jgi:porphobilinogen deaminase
VGCRGTEFCKAQTSTVLKRLNEKRPGAEFEIVEVPGNGDQSPILDALGAGVVDLHVRGMREVPLELPDDVHIAACTERIDPFDVLIAEDGVLLEDLPDGAKLGVESARVSVQIGSFREELAIEKMEGTIDRFLQYLNEIDHQISRQVVRAERAFLRELNVKLTDPVAVHGSFEADTLVLEALLGDEVSGAILRDDLDGDPAEEHDLGIRLAKLFVADGARDYLASYD